MLVLSRKANEAIHIGDNVKITIVKLKGNSVRLGIEAPKDVRVMRSEIASSESNDNSASVTISIDPTADASETTSVADSTVDADAACSTTISDSRCAAESFLDAAEDTRCPSRPSQMPCDDDGYEGDCWSVSSMKRRVRKVVASRK